MKVFIKLLVLLVFITNISMFISCTDDDSLKQKPSITNPDDDEDKDDDDNGKEDEGEISRDIITGKAVPKAFSAKLYANVSGNIVPDEMGFEYCYNKSFEKFETARISVEGHKGDYELEVFGLVDQMKVYYRAFIIYDGKTFYGKTLNFNTKQGTYTIDGKTYNFVKVDGGPNGSFSMMQTELPPSAEFEIDGFEMGKLDHDDNRIVTKGELRTYLTKSPIFFRLPTAAEWIFAASGGFQGNGYTYSGSNNLDEVGWYTDNANGSQRRPGQKKPNELGFFDMSGNYSEFVVNFTPAQFDIIADYMNAAKSSLKEMSAEIFNVMWASVDAPSRGGNWTSSKDKCAITATEPGLRPENRFDGTKYTFRFIYTRPTNGEEAVAPYEINVETVSANPMAYSATLEGRVTGTRVPDEVGFEYSYSNDFKKNETGVVSAAGIGGRFSLPAQGLVDLAKVYYRAYAKADGGTIYGPTKSFETAQGTYKLDGKTYKFIKVTGLPTGSFSIMQTEFPASCEFEMAEGLSGQLDKNNDGFVTKGEMRAFLSSPVRFILRTPTAEEWKYAANGGQNSQNFIYSGSNVVGDVAWFSNNSNGLAHEPALKKPNELGIYDMSGNYAEFCANLNDDQLWERVKLIKNFINEPKEIPAEQFNRMWEAGVDVCGGNWNSNATDCKIESSMKFDLSKNKYDSKYYTFRFVYSRPD